MILRNGRREVIDLGPHQNGDGISSMRVIAGAGGSDGSGGWKSSTMTISSHLQRSPREKRVQVYVRHEYTMKAPCLECGAQAEVAQPHAVYCCTKCRNRAAKRRQRQ